MVYAWIYTIIFYGYSLTAETSYNVPVSYVLKQLNPTL